MAQKSITSFFKLKPSVEETKADDGISIRKPSTKKRLRILSDSSDENEDSQPRKSPKLVESNGSDNGVKEDNVQRDTQEPVDHEKDKEISSKKAESKSKKSDKSSNSVTKKLLVEKNYDKESPKSKKTNKRKVSSPSSEETTQKKKNELESPKGNTKSKNESSSMVDDSSKKKNNKNGKKSSPSSGDAAKERKKNQESSKNKTADPPIKKENKEKCESHSDENKEVENSNTTDKLILELPSSVKEEKESKETPKKPLEVASQKNECIKMASIFSSAKKKPKQESPKEVKKDSPKLEKSETVKMKTDDSPAIEEKDNNNECDEKKEVDKKPAFEVKKMANFNLFSKADKSSNDTSDGENYNPAKAKYDPIKDAFWKKDQSTPYLALARTFQVIEETQGRLKMIEILGNFFSSVMMLNPKDLLSCVCLSINCVAPAYEGLELGVADFALMKIICETTGRSLSHIKAQTHEIGDLGLVAEKSRVAQRVMFHPQPLTVQGVFQKLRKVAATSGPAKLNIIRECFIACRSSEARFFIRSLLGKLRIGLAELSLMKALAAAIVKLPDDSTMCNKVDEPSSKRNLPEEIALTLRTAHCQCPNYDIIIPNLIEHGVSQLLERCPMKPGVPIKPMLAHPTKGVSEVLQRFEGLNITCEWKYDGERAQIHMDEKGTISIYSRNQENHTTKYPDIISRIGNFRKSDSVRSYILDSEVVAWDVEQKQILPFQVLSTRKRKNVDVEEIKVQVCVYAFDLLYLNGKPLVTETFNERRRLLYENFQEIEGEWKFATKTDTNDVDEIQQCLEDSIKGNCEGLMIKTLDVDATYEIAKRSRNWLKLKKDYLSGVGDSLDLVVIGGYRGKGKRTGTFGGYLLACYDDENEEYQSICKIGTGFSDENLKTHSEFFKQHLINNCKSYYRVDSSLAPDDWFEPVQVWEIKCADLSLSPVHKAAIGRIEPDKGISLRFPRFIRIRDDKSAENATSAEQVAQMYSMQDQIKNQNSKTTNNDFDEYY